MMHRALVMAVFSTGTLLAGICPDTLLTWDAPARAQDLSGPRPVVGLTPHGWRN